MSVDQAALAWGRWMLARGALSFALEEEVRAAFDADSPFLDPDGRIAIDACERLADAIARFRREIEARPPPAALLALGESLRGYLDWRGALAERQASALTAGGWPAAAALVGEAEQGRALHAAFLGELAALDLDSRGA